MLRKYEPSYPGLIFEDNSDIRKANLLKAKEDNQRLIQLKKDFQEKQRLHKEIENEKIKQSFNEYKQLKAIDQETSFRQNRKLYDYNVSQEYIHKNSLKKDSLVRRSFKDQFIDDLNTKKETEYNKNLKKRNDSIFRHMKEYEEYINKKESQPIQLTLNNLPYSQDEKIEQAKNDPSDFLTLQKAPKSPMKKLKKIDDSYNKRLADIHQKEKLSLKQSFSAMSLSGNQNLIYSNQYQPQNENLTKSINITSHTKGPLFNSINFNSNSDNKQIKYLTKTQDNSFIAKMIVKMRALGIEGMINLFNQMLNKDKYDNRTIDYYDFRGIIISVYRLDFSFDDCKQFIQTKGSSINLHKISIKDFLNKISNFNSIRKVVVDKVISKLFNTSKIIDLSNDILVFLNERYSALDNLNRKRVKDLIYFLHEFYLLNNSKTSVNAYDFSIFLSCFSLSYDNDNDYIDFIKIIFDLAEN